MVFRCVVWWLLREPSRVPHSMLNKFGTLFVFSFHVSLSGFPSEVCVLIQFALYLLAETSSRGITRGGPEEREASCQLEN